MKATTLLERQHRNLQQLCEAMERGSGSLRASLLPQLAGDLVAHLAVEEQVFYPAAAESLRDDNWLRTSGKSHAQVMHALHRALDAPLEGEEFARAIVELRALIDLHVDQEESALFPRLEQTLGPEQLRELALAMMAVYHTKVEQGYDRESGRTSQTNAVARP